MTVRVTGPLFDGRGQQGLDDIAEETAFELGRAGEDMVLAGLDRTLRNPTGAYRSRITMYARGPQARVHDQMGIYGPWLEGTGSRNKTTRFKGYRNFRQATQYLDRLAADIANRVVRENIGKLGG